MEYDAKLHCTEHPPDALFGAPLLNEHLDLGVMIKRGSLLTLIRFQEELRQLRVLQYLQGTHRLGFMTWGLGLKYGLGLGLIYNEDQVQEGSF